MNFSAKYIGEFVPGVTRLQYFYRIAAYVGNQKIAESAPVYDFGPPVLDGDHAMSLQWQPVVGSTRYTVFKRRDRAPDADDIFYDTGLGETGILDVGYPATTRNSFLNPGRIHVAGAGVGSINGIDGDINLVGGNNIVIHPHAPVGQDITIAAYPAGSSSQIQFNFNGQFAASGNLTWQSNRMEITGTLQVNGRIEGHTMEIGNTQINGTLNVLGLSTFRGRVQIGGPGVTRPLTILNIPTSSSGLLNGDVYSSGGTLHIVHSTPGGED
jgi:hypothetical protein